MNMLGHNNGPTLEGGYSWRKHSWSKARADLLPTLPMEVLRTRVKRAKALGLPYKTYASVRASTGRDVVGFLFSNNALCVMRDGQTVPQRHLNKLVSTEAEFAALAHLPLDPARLEEQLAGHGIDLVAARAPHFAQAWSEIESAVLTPLHKARLPKDGVIVIGDTDAEREWCAAGKLAGFVHSNVHFGVI